MTSALVKVTDNYGLQITCKTLLDTCSTANFITKKLVNQLKVHKTQCSLTIGAMNDLSTTVDYYTELTIQSMHSDYKKSLIFFIVPKITDLVPGEIVQREKLQIPKNLKLADPYFYKPSDIDMLIGAGPTLSMFCNGQIILSDGGELVLQKTKLG